MGERERLALFNILSDKVQDARILDAYAGGGTLGIEALSRGAKTVISIEKNRQAYQILIKNSEKLNLQNEIHPLCERVEKFLQTTSDQFDIVFMDPPYDEFQPKMVAEMRKVLSQNGLLIVSHPNEPTEIEGLVIKKTTRYARAHITFYTPLLS